MRGRFRPGAPAPRRTRATGSPRRRRRIPAGTGPLPWICRRALSPRTLSATPCRGWRLHHLFSPRGKNEKRTLFSPNPQRFRPAKRPPCLVSGRCARSDTGLTHAARGRWSKRQTECSPFPKDWLRTQHSTVACSMALQEAVARFLAVSRLWLKWRRGCGMV